MKSKADVVELLKTTPIVQVACQKADICRATYYRWREDDEKFKVDTDQAIKEGIRLINDISESQLISLIKDKNVTSIIYWLKHHHKDYSENRLYLSDTDQKRLVDSINTIDTKGFHEFILDKVSKGEISKSMASSLALTINRTYPRGVESSKAKIIAEELKKLAEIIDEFRGVDKNDYLSKVETVSEINVDP